MSDLRQNLLSELRDSDYRYAYAESFLNTKIAAQIKTLREQRGMKQAEVGAAIGTPQSGYSRFEDANHSVWKTDTLWKIAKALDVRLNISFETFGSLIDDKEHFTKESLQRPSFDNDQTFTESTVQIDRSVGICGGAVTSLLAGVVATRDNIANLSVRGRHRDRCNVKGIPVRRSIAREKRYRNYGRREDTTAAP
jgi:transcriptional regulator with XRE-family HTH domain